MADESQRQVPPEAAGGDTVVVTLLQSGEVNYKGKGHQLHLTQKGLRLVAPQTQVKIEAAGGGGDVTVISVNWRDVICACETPIKKSKSSQNTTSAGSPDSSQNHVFIVHYMDKNQKTKKIKLKNITLEATQGTSEGWIAQIEEKRKEGKPQKLLIIINPIGGKGTARQTFEKKVQPVFALAGVDLVVKVTERAKHAIEIAKTFDVSSVDGVIAMGGDGLYMEILHGLTLRKQEEEGVNFNDPDAKLVPPTVRVGIIPAGTGNAASGWCNGVIDVDTAVLNIIRGETNRAGIFSVHEPGKLVYYAGLLLGNGYFSIVTKRTEELRWMKRARYPYAMLASIFGKKKILEFDVEVLKTEQEANKEDEQRDGATAAATGWTKLGRKQLTATMAFAAKILDDEDLLEINPFYPTFDLFILEKTSGLQNLKFIFSFYGRKRSALQKEFLEWVRDIRGVRFSMADSTEEGASSQQQTDLLDLCKLLNIDGEVITLSEPKFDVRFHSQFLHMFCVPDLFRSEKKS